MQRGQRSILVLVNPRSGVRWSFESVRRAVDAHWEKPGQRIVYQFCQSVDDGMAKARAAADEGVDTVLVVGGDGTVNSIGRALVNTSVSLGAIPVGSGNGFARHFGIPLNPRKAVEVLANASVEAIDVGLVNGRPFLVTCSMAWDAAIVRSFNRSPVRGILPYVFAGVQEYFDYRIQPMRVEVDSGEELVLPDAMVCTVANLTQYGGGAIIAPQARAGDGYLELVVALNENLPKLIANLRRLFDGSINVLPEVVSRRFKRLVVRRQEAVPIQVDGELVDVGRDIEVQVLPRSLNVLVPPHAANE